METDRAIEIVQSLADGVDLYSGEHFALDSSCFTATYGWDLAGNPTSRTENSTHTSYTLGTGNRLASWTGGSYNYNAAGCVTNITHGPDTLALSWNSRYQITSIATNGTVAAAYDYDPLGRRYRTTRDGSAVYHIYDGVHCVADVNSAGDLLRSYTWGAGIDNLLSFTDYTAGETNTYFALTDQLGTIHALADENGTVVESYRYDAWGRVIGVHDANGMPLEESAIGNHYLWQGRWYSWETGLYYFRARWYDPVTGRWLSKDPIGINGGLNQYVFCGNNPVNLRDPSGLCGDEYSPWVDSEVWAAAGDGAIKGLVAWGDMVLGPLVDNSWYYEGTEGIAYSKASGIVSQQAFLIAINAQVALKAGVMSRGASVASQFAKANNLWSAALGQHHDAGTYLVRLGLLYLKVGSAREAAEIALELVDWD